jgi:amino acid transporter
MKKNESGIPLAIVIIFSLIGLIAIRASLHDAIVLGQTEDLAGIAIGILFATPPIFLYIYGNRKKDLSPREKDIRNTKGACYVLLLIHVPVLIYLLCINGLNIVGSMVIVYIYTLGMIGFCVYKLYRLHINPDEDNMRTYKTFSDGEVHYINKYNENGIRKTTEEIIKEISANDNQTEDKDQRN